MFLFTFAREKIYQNKDVSVTVAVYNNKKFKISIPMEILFPFFNTFFRLIYLTDARTI